jgi:hypothetical protein
MQTFIEDGDLCFYADVPALAYIGERFDALTDEVFGFAPRSGQVGAGEQFVKDVDENSGSGPDLDAMREMLYAQMELFRESPLFKQANDQYAKMRQQLESLRAMHPELAQRQLDMLESMQRIVADPRAMEQELPGLFPGASRSSKDTPKTERPRRGPRQLKFNCGAENSMSAEQTALLREFLNSQEQLRPQIETALRQMHAWMNDPKSILFERSLFPAASSDIPLQCFQIREIALRLDYGRRILMTFDTLFAHLEEHGCYISIRNGAVERFGTADDIYQDYAGGDVDE